MLAALANAGALGARRGAARVRALHASAVLRHGAAGDGKGGSGCSHDEDPRLRKAVEEFVAAQPEEERPHPPELLGSDPELRDVLAGNKEWVARMNKEDPEFFKRLGAKQEPRYLYIGCSDARVDPSRLMGMDHGALFVHRNVGNVVSGTDLNLLSVIDFAVNYLKVPHILVVGHYDCGAVRGSLARPDDGGLGIVENWLRNIRDVARFHKNELLQIADQEERVRRLVELNVVEQCLNVLKVGTVQRRRMQSFVRNNYALPKIHGLVFDPANGVLTKLPLDFNQLNESDRAIYDLYKIPKWLERRSSFVGTPPAKQE